jgi:hypothetical protein
MAYTERYVSSTAGGGGAGDSEGDPWTLSESLAQAVAGERVNIKSDAGYSTGDTTATNVANFQQFLVFRGYDTTIGDLENLGRNADTSLDTTGFPIITLTGTLEPLSRYMFQNISFVGSVAAPLVGNSSVDSAMFINCSFVNSSSSTNAMCLELDNYSVIIGNDFECSASTHGDIFRCDVGPSVIGNRFKMGLTSGDFQCLQAQPSMVATGNIFIGNGAGTAIYIEIMGTNCTFMNNTIYNFDKAIMIGNNEQFAHIISVNNHITDCNEMIDNLYIGTNNYTVIEMFNRTRDNTTSRTGISTEGVLLSEVTTDTGGAETDYANAAGDNLTLITGAPGVAAGLGM